jgi:hypothetical protein
MEDGGVELKRAKRRRLTTNAIERQKRIAKTCGIKHKHDQPHRYAKHHATNCGIPRCVMCGNPRRIFGDKTIQEKKFIEAFKNSRGTIELEDE